MSFYNDKVLPRAIDVLMRGGPVDRARRKATAGLAGEVVEIGFGSGRNVPFYPSAVTRVQAVDPAVAGREIAARRVAASPVPIEYVGLDGQSLPIESGTADHVLITWTLCTIPDAMAALAEIHRVLKPGGKLHFVEHGRSPDSKVVRWQDRLNPVQNKVAGGCNLNRPIDKLITDAGFQIQNLDTYYMTRPKSYGYTFQGVAVRS